MLQFVPYSQIWKPSSLWRYALGFLDRFGVRRITLCTLHEEPLNYGSEEKEIVIIFKEKMPCDIIPHPKTLAICFWEQNTCVFGLAERRVSGEHGMCSCCNTLMSSIKDEKNVSRNMQRIETMLFGVTHFMFSILSSFLNKIINRL